MRLVPCFGDGASVAVAAGAEAEVGRRTWTPGDVRVSRQSCRVLVGAREVRLQSLRATLPPLEYRRRDDDPFSPLAFGETVVLPAGATVRLGTPQVAFRLQAMAPAEEEKKEAGKNSPSSTNGEPTLTGSLSEHAQEGSQLHMDPVQTKKASPALSKWTTDSSQGQSQDHASASQRSKSTTSSLHGQSQESSASQGGGGWIKVKKARRLAPPMSSTSPPSPPPRLHLASPASSSYMSKRRKRDDHQCEGALSCKLYCAATLTAVSDRITERYSEMAQLQGAGGPLVAPGCQPFDEKITFWARQALERGFVCAFEVSALNRPDPETREFRVALGWKQCRVVRDAPERDLATFVGDSLSMHSDMAACPLADEKESVEFSGTETEQLLGDLMTQLSQSIMPARQPSVVHTPMKYHQLQALQFMLNKELVQFHALPPFWEERRRYGPRPWSSSNAHLWGTHHLDMAKTLLLMVNRFDRERGSTSHLTRFPRTLVSHILSMVPIDSTFFHPLTCIETRRRPKGSLGGILADDMGLGKGRRRANLRHFSYFPPCPFQVRLCL